MNKTLATSALLSLTLIMISTGCAGRQDVRFRPPTTPKYIVTPARDTASTQTKDGSLWVDSSPVGQISDFRARSINDLVTILVVESTSASNTANVKTEREDSGSRSLTNLIGLERRLFPRSANNSSLVSGKTKDEFDSTGSNQRTESISSTITARIVDRLPNGNLVLEAVREIVVNNERQTMVIRGIARPIDIDDTNTISSTKVADLQIHYSGTGVLSENLRRGWMSRILNYIWPL